MLPFKSPASRLVRLFKKGRDNWREKALERQQEIRGLEIKVSDLSESRENWKKRAIEAELQLKQLWRGGSIQEKKMKSKPYKQIVR